MVVIARWPLHALAVQHEAAQACPVQVSEEGTTTFRNNGAPRAHGACRSDGADPGALTPLRVCRCPGRTVIPSGVAAHTCGSASHPTGSRLESAASSLKSSWDGQAS